MYKSRPLYNWQKDAKKSKEERKTNFIKNYSDKLKLSKRYIEYSEINEIKNKYHINEQELLDIINNSNNDYLNSEKHKRQQELDSILSKNDKYIDSNYRQHLRKKFNETYYKFYDELEFDIIIDKENKLIVEKEKNIKLDNLKSFLHSNNNLIDDEEFMKLKTKYDEPYFDSCKELNLEKLIKEHNSEIEHKRILKEHFIEDEYIPISKLYEIKSKCKYNSINWDEIIDEHNNSYIKEQLNINRTFFDNINGKSLDIPQREAVLTDDDTTQIVAGAGTGKTLTIQAKVKYLIEKENVKPEEILCISFSNSARDDLEKKLKKTVGNIPEVRTFHSMGFSILGHNNEEKEIPDYELYNLIDNYFKDLLFKKPEVLKEIIEFFCYYFNIIYINEKDLKLETIKSILNKLDEYDEKLKEYLKVDSVKRKKEYLNNIPELIIANYLYIHKINYNLKNQALMKEKNYDTYISNYFEYLFDNMNDLIPNTVKLEFIKDFDENFGYDKIDLYPSFFLPNNDLYIDVNPNRNVLGKINELNKTYKTKIITIFNPDADVKSLLNDVISNLLKNNVLIEDADYEKLFDLLIVQEKSREYKRFLKTVIAFINLLKGNAKNIDYKGNDISNSVFKKYLNENKEKYSGSLRKRNNFYLNFIKKIYDIYTNYLNENDYIDYNDMINDAVIKLRNGGIINKYKYVIVDEYQDTSYTRYNLLKEIQNVTGAKVVVVGDDWQSIYGFTGCDVNLFSHFDKYFKHPKMVKTNITYRNSQKLIDVVGKFVQKNKNQIPKQLKSVKIENKSPIKIFGYTSRAEEVLALINILDKISKEKNDAKVLILGRNNYDIDEISCDTIFEMTKFNDYTKIDYSIKRDLNIEYRTIHKSKGLQADYVVVLNLNDKINGFPNKIVNDPILEFVNNTEDEGIEFPEERRLFYVALTRTQNDVYLFSNSIKPSYFIEEIRKEKGVESLDFTFSNEEIITINQLLKKEYDIIETNNICPKCKIGKINLVLNNKKETSYFRCSNFCGWEGGAYHNGNYQGENKRQLSVVKYSKVCPKCNNMLIVKKNRKDGTYFLGCNSYEYNVPDTCGHTESLDKSVESFLNALNKNENLNKTRNGVYYINEYIPKEKLFHYRHDKRINFSNQLLEYKNSNNGNILLPELIKIITYVSNNMINENINRIVLIAIPPSKIKKIKYSSMRKSIDKIEELFKKGDLKTDYGLNKEILNYKDLIKRIKDVPTAHLGEGRASVNEHINSMKCGGYELYEDNIAYIVLDDITTTGNSMKACNDILIQNGVNKENIYNIAIGATVRDDNEEI